MLQQQLPPRVQASLLRGSKIFSHAVTSARRGQNSLSSLTSFCQAVVIVKPDMDFSQQLRNGAWYTTHDPGTLRGFDIIYREVPEAVFEKYSKFAYGAEEKDDLAHFVEKRRVRDLHELETVIAEYVDDLSTFGVARGFE